MRKGNLNREQVIEIVGLTLVKKLEGMDCDFTKRLQTDGDEDIEFAAIVSFIDNEGNSRSLTAYYYQTPEALAKVENDMGVLDWEIEGYEIW